MAYLRVQDTSSEASLQALEDVKQSLDEIKIVMEEIGAALIPVAAEASSTPQTVGASSVFATSGSPVQLSYTGDQITALGMFPTDVNGVPDVSGPYIKDLLVATSTLIGKMDLVLGKLDVPLSSLETTLTQILSSLSIPMPQLLTRTNSQVNLTATNPITIAELLARGLFYTVPNEVTRDLNAGNYWEIHYTNLPYLQTGMYVPDLPVTSGSVPTHEPLYTASERGGRPSELMISSVGGIANSINPWFKLSDPSTNLTLSGPMPETYMRLDGLPPHPA